jgi:hypothetical protein
LPGIGIIPAAAQFTLCTRPVWRALARNIGHELFAGGASPLAELMAYKNLPSQT